MEEDEGEEIDQQRVNTFKVLALASASKTGDFGIITKDVIKMIAAGDVYVLLSLAQTNTTFAQLMRSEDVWRALFSKDFPEDYLFCGGELPFYIVTNGHPLEKYVTIDPLDKCAWKRFYLWTRELYGGLRNKQATLMKYHLPDVNAQLSWIFLVIIALLAKNPTSTGMDTLWNYDERNNVYKTVIDLNLPWTRKYLLATQTSTNVRDAFFSRDNAGWGFATYIPKTDLGQTNSSPTTLFDEDDADEFHQFMMTQFSRDPYYRGAYDVFVRPYYHLFYTLANVHDTRCVTSMGFLFPKPMPYPLTFRTGIWMPYMVTFKNHLEVAVGSLKDEHEFMSPLEKFNFEKVERLCDPLDLRASDSYSDLYASYQGLRFKPRRIPTCENIFVCFARSPRVGIGKAKLVVNQSCIECGIQSLPLFACADCRDVSQTWCGNQCARSHVCK